MRIDLEQYAPLIQKYVNKYAFRYDMRKDLTVIGQMALVKARESFDETRGVPFIGYAYLFVRHELRDYMFKEYKHHKHTCKFVEIDWLASKSDSVYETVRKVEQGERVKEAFNQLDVRTSFILRGRYFDEVSQEDIAAVLGISRQRVSQIAKVGIKKLKEILDV